MLSWAQQCYPPAIHVLTHLHVQEKSENGFVKFTFFVSHIYPKKKMSVRRHFAPNFRLWTSTQLCKNQTSNGNRATMSCIFCEEVPGLTFPEQTPCCIIHMLLVISATSISFLLLLYLCISSSSNDEVNRVLEILLNIRNSVQFCKKNRVRAKEDPIRRKHLKETISSKMEVAPRYFNTANTVFTVYTIQTALCNLNSSMYA